MRGSRPMVPERDGWLPFRLGTYTVCIVAAIGCAEGSRMPSPTTMMPEASALLGTADQGGAARGASETGAGESSVPSALPRKIIYNAQVELVVESIATVADELTRLVKASGGYISETDVLSYSHARRMATWKVRIPVDRFEAFMTEVTRLGELQKNHLDSQDVTQEYYDLEARIANKQREEQRLLKHLADSTGKLEDILAVERELSRVRGEVEQMQGRLRYLTNQSALSTVTIMATEVKDYTPPVSPTFTTQVGRTFRLSVARLADFGEAVMLLIVAILPWLPVVVVVALPFWWILRRRRTTHPPRAA
jgi:Domain of unknown function (DUF4349)